MKSFGSRLPDLRSNSMEYINNLNTYLSNDIKSYLQNVIKPLPKNGIIIWGTNDAIPEGWSEAAEYRGVFLRGYGSITHTQNNGATIGNSATTHSSGAIGAVQGDALRNLKGHFRVVKMDNNTNSQSYSGVFTTEAISTGGWGTSSNWANWGTENMVFNAKLVIPTDNEIRPVNKAVKFIKYTNAAVLPNIPDPPQSKVYYRYLLPGAFYLKIQKIKRG